MKRYIIIILLFVQGVFAQAIQFEAKVNKTSVPLNEKLRIDFTMNGDGDNFVPPNFEGFRVFAGPYQSVKIEYMNGRGVFNKTYSYFLVPTHRGSAIIRPASVEINGKIYKTNAIKITITAPVDQPGDPNDTRPTPGDDLHLVAEVSKTNPYINEPISVVYKLYFDFNVNIREYRELEKPKYNDFWSQNIEVKMPKAEQGTYNGQRCMVATLKKTVLYPQKSGKLEIEPLRLDMELEVPSNRRTIFGQLILVPDSRQVSSGAKTINVKALPEAGKPEDFSGAVGRFTFNATPTKTTLKNGESFDLNISVSGSGNLKLFNLPKPVVPAALEMYDPVHKENVSTSLSGMSGKISDNYTIIPQFKGKYPIKPMSFSYFDLNSGKYKTITSPEIMVNVLDGPSPNGTVAENNPSEPAKMKISGSEQFGFIKLKTKLTNIHKEDFFGSGTFAALMLFPFLCIPLVVAFRRKKEAIDRDVAGNKIRQSGRLAKKYLSEAKMQMGNKERFYIALEKSMHNFLKAKLHIETSEMSKDKIREILLEKAGSDKVNAFIGLMESCEFARYAPSTESAMQDDYNRAEQLISELEKQI